MWVDFDGAEHPGEVLKVEGGGYLLCMIHTDPEWDYGRASARVMPEQVVAARITHVRPRTPDTAPDERT
ncbi:hypothetical protein DS6A_75 [Mycobacterium phage DS6A]|uniref:Uncharacterized protein n=1 Tax=Mycobacterium phage DS6A TaxID=45764 RepID=G8I4I5_9CAUD|nr:hypothetical protein DS6A_75 [Mycobacterium phage DS6A]AER47629.1 hypothetical protein DS6A_75 [Mycobacterium phage DS6A]